MTIEIPHNHDVFHAIADPTRRRLLELLRHGERSVSTLADAFAITRPGVSKHLQVLEDAGLVTARRAGRETHYALHPDLVHQGPLHAVATWLHGFAHHTPAAPTPPSPSVRLPTWTPDLD